MFYEAHAQVPRSMAFHRLNECRIASGLEHLVMNEFQVTGKIRGYAEPF
jgi:hypothetical protein